MTKNPFVLLTGPMLMGALFSYLLNGVFLMQVYHYSMTYAEKDRRFFVCLVGAVAVLEIAHLCLSTHTTYEVLARGFGNPLVLLRLPMSGAPLPAMNGLVGFCTQLFFAWRIKNLAKNVMGKMAAWVVTLTAVLQMGASIGVAIQFTLHNGEAMLLRQLSTAVIIWLAGSFGCDIFISITMVCLLVDAKASTSYASSKGIINALIVHTIENGLVTTVCALVVLISYFALPDTAYNISFGYLLGRLYANVLLATLNGRQRMRSAGGGSEDGRLPTTKSSHVSSGSNHFQLGGLPASSTRPGNATHPYPVINITTNVRIDEAENFHKSKLYP